MTDADKTWDIFISHATEDKEHFVRPLANALKNLGLEIWYDEFTLHLGDSLSGSIDKGLASSKFGAVVISPNFIKKKWTDYELRGLISKEIYQGRVILPIWYNISPREVMEFSPTLADKIAVITEGRDVTDVAIQIFREVQPEKYLQYKRTGLVRLAQGEEIDADDFEEYAREILVGNRRLLLLRALTDLKHPLALFREMLGNFRDSENRYQSALENKGFDAPIFSPTQPGSFIPGHIPTTYGADSRIEQAQETARNILRRVKIEASDTCKSVQSASETWNKVDPTHQAPELLRLLYQPLDLISYVSETVSKTNPDGDVWWVRDKLRVWVKTIPEAEASLDSAITLLISWARFDPIERDGPIEPSAASSETDN